MWIRSALAVGANAVGIPVPAWLASAIPWLESALESHWSGQYYESMIPAPTDKAPYDPNSDIVMAAIYGAVAVTDTMLLSTAALLRSQWDDAASTYYYPINGADQLRKIGPMLGRYPGDVYDGDDDQSGDDHPWAICTCNFAELYYRLAGEITLRRRGPARCELSRILQPGGNHIGDDAGCGRHGAPSGRRPDAASGHVSQRSV